MPAMYAWLQLGPMSSGPCVDGLFPPARNGITIVVALESCTRSFGDTKNPFTADGPNEYSGPTEMATLPSVGLRVGIASPSATVPRIAVFSETTYVTETGR